MKTILNTSMTISIASELHKIAAILRQQPIPFYGLLSKEQWNTLQKFCSNQLPDFWAKNKSDFFKLVFDYLKEFIFDGEEPTHARMMPVLNFLKHAPHIADPKLKHFLFTIKIDEPKETPMDLNAFKAYMRDKTELMKMQKKSSISIYDEKHPITDDKFIANGVCYLTFANENANKESATKLAKNYLTKKYGSKVNVNYFDKKSVLGSYTESFNTLMADPEECAVNYTVEK